MGWVVGLVLMGMVAAPVGQLQPHYALGDAPSFRFTSVQREHQQVCPEPGTVCALPAPGAKLRPATFWVTPSGDRRIPLFFRPPADGPLGEPAWDLLLIATFKQRNTPGTVVISISDENVVPKEEHEVIAVWQERLDAYRQIAFFLHLDPSTQAFEPKHTYRVRVLQLIGKREQILAEGSMRLE